MSLISPVPGNIFANCSISSAYAKRTIPHTNSHFMDELSQMDSMNKRYEKSHKPSGALYTIQLGRWISSMRSQLKNALLQSICNHEYSAISTLLKDMYIQQAKRKISNEVTPITIEKLRYEMQPLLILIA